MLNVNYKDRIPNVEVQYREGKRNECTFFKVIAKQKVAFSGHVLR